MTKVITMLAIVSLLAGCYGSSDPKSAGNPDFEHEFVGVVKMRTWLGSDAVYDIGSYRILIDPGQATTLRTRSSCSGFEVVGRGDYPVGYTLIVKAYGRNIEYDKTPKLIRPHYVEGWAPQCLEPEGCELPWYPEICDWL